jgi:DNA-binding MarR family transcriptional regulator
MDARVKPPTANRTSPGRRANDVVGRGVAQWRAERPDLDSSGKEVVGRLLHLEGVVLQTVNAALAPHGLKYLEYAVLATLRVSGAPYRMTPSNLQARLLFTSGGLSNLLKRLEGSGWIQRTDDPEDGRGVLVCLTAKGRRLADRAMPDHASAELRLLRMFSAQEREQLAGLLARMMAGSEPVDA